MASLDLTDEQVLALVQQLPEDQKRRLLAKLEGPCQTKKKRTFGSAKDDILYMAPDFNAPLEEFEEYR